MKVTKGEQYRTKKRTDYPGIYQRYERYGGRFVVVWKEPSSKGAKQRNRTFKTLEDAVRFQYENKYRIYKKRHRLRWGKDAELPKIASLGHGYEALRKAAQVLDATRQDADPRVYRHVDAALAAVYQAEDEMLQAIGWHEKSPNGAG